MKTFVIISFVCAMVAAGASMACSAGPSDDFARNAFREILSQADSNKDGKLSVSECKAIYTDAAKAEKNCAFWDANLDGVITEDEYAEKAMSMGRKK